MITRTLCLAAALALPSTLSFAQTAPAKEASPSSTLDSTRARAKDMAQKAIAWLRTQQDQKTGGWGIREGAPVFPAITGLVVSGMAAHKDALNITDNDTSLQAGIKFMLDSQQPDGGIYQGMLPSYNTAICLTALSSVQTPPQVVDARKRAIAFLTSLQYGDAAITYENLGESAKVVTEADPYYGGWGYGRHGRPDLSNSAFAIEALHAAGVSESDPVFKRALVFLKRCQMVEKIGDTQVNDMPYAKGSTQGGFIYATAVNKDSGGIGQSAAGEIAESLSGTAGSATTVTLSQKGKDNKPVTLARKTIEERVQKAINDSIELSRGIVPTEFIVVLGPTGDGASANSFTIRSNGPTSLMAELAKRVFEAELADSGNVTTESVDNWRARIEHRAYGSMSYAGYKSMIYAGLRANDPRVQAALAWIANNYTLSENPGMGTDGYYYYLLTFSRAMKASGLNTLPPATTQQASSDTTTPLTRNWREDLVNTLAKYQNEDGSFRPVDDRWMEADPLLVTAYCLVALGSVQ